MKTEAEKRARAQASNPKSPELADVSGQVFRTGILANGTVYQALEPLPQGLKLEAEFLVRLEPDRLEASAAEDDQALNPRNALRQMGTTYTPDGREIRDWGRHILREKARLRIEAEASDEADRVAQDFVDCKDDPVMAQAAAVAMEKEREAIAAQIRCENEILKRHDEQVVALENSLNDRVRVTADGKVEELLPEEPLEP